MRRLRTLAPQPRGRRTAGAICALVVMVGLTGCGAGTRTAATGTQATVTATRAADTTRSAAGSTPASLSTDGIVRATSPTAPDAGRFLDPYPIDISRAPDGTPLEAFSGTSDELMLCRGAIAPGCFAPSTIGVTVSPALSAEFRADDISVVSQANHNIFRTSDGEWEMALSVQVKRGSAEWTLCLHAHPESTASPNGIPSQWVADSILVGSPKQPALANYDAKYLEADGQLYLIYSRHLSNPPMGRDGIVAQRMITPTQPATSAPVTLLAPSGLNSERADEYKPSDTFELVETGNIIEIGSVWVLIYSTGVVTEPDYKIGVAYADSPVPPSGYRKVLIPDPQHVWGTSGDEVDYLLQSEEPGWPHYVRAAVQAPGVGSIVHRGDAWYLFFAGHPPSATTNQDGRLDPALRIPYYVKLHVAIPRGNEAVAHATGQQLASWITPQLGG